ncbi:formimidoylglutamate deiminase [Pseudonocardia sp. TMWB2A]|uniref:formimidoylglutamate deiminase n=1 Tax=Pseudonocardia sp. TMWB2A TaxID=687430 RepID=UPI00307F093D
MTSMTIFADTALLPEGWAHNVRVAVADGRITSVTPNSTAETGDTRISILLPAPANIHSHAFQRAMAGLTEGRGPDASDSFWTWRKLMYRFMEQLGPDDVEAIAAFVQMEMLEAGYAGSVEFHYLHHQPGGAPYAKLGELSERIAAAAATSGIGLTLAPVLYQYGGCDQRPLNERQVRFGNDFDRFARLWEEARASIAALPADARMAVAPHSLRAVGPDSLALCAALSPADPMHIHIAEQVGEVNEVVAAWGQRPIEWLYDHQAVDSRWTLIHATQMEPHETEMVASSGAVAGLCPITEANLGDGIFDGVRYLGANGRFAIGSDSNIHISLAHELRALEYSQRLRDKGRAMLATEGRSAGRLMLEEAAKGGAVSSGRESGAIAAGKLADLLALDGNATNLLGRSGDQLIDSWIFAGDDRLVTDVWSAGRHQVQDGRHIARAAIESEYRRVLKKLVG